jgi:hypothetical protein
LTKDAVPAHTPTGVEKCEFSPNYKWYSESKATKQVYESFLSEVTKESSRFERCVVF